MKLATVRTENGTQVARLEQDELVMIPRYSNLGELLAQADWQQIAATEQCDRVPVEQADLGPVSTTPSKVLCVGLNYRGHIIEMGRELPEYPTVFAKFADTLTGPFDPVEAVAEDPELDWEGELAIIIGKTAYRVSEKEAGEHIAGYTLANDISMRGWQFRSIEWLQGKIWARSTPLGPVMVTPDELDFSTAVLKTTVNGEVMQEHGIDDLLFKPEYLVSYLSTMLPLRPGDVILTGTPGGVGRARKPALYLKAGDQVEVTVDGVGTLKTDMVQPERVPAAH